MLKKVSSIESLDKGALVAFFDRLPADEQNRINFKKKRNESIAARFVLSELLHSHFLEDMSDKISADENGKPYIIGRPDIFISLSHSKGTVAVAVGEKPLGIDIELIRPVSGKLKKRVCKEAPETDEEFFRVWTLKEAYLKAAGISFSKMLSLDIEKFDKSIKTQSEITDGFMLSMVEIND